MIDTPNINSLAFRIDFLILIAATRILSIPGGKTPILEKKVAKKKARRIDILYHLVGLHLFKKKTFWSFSIENDLVFLLLNKFFLNQKKLLQN